jgi:hypothetical protein
MSSESVSVFAKLKDHGLLLQTDANLANVCALVAGAPVRGSWWAHPRSHEIFRVTRELAEHPDVLVNKLISGNLPSQGTLAGFSCDWSRPGVLADRAPVARR